MTKNDWARLKEIIPKVTPYKQNPALVAQDGFVGQSSWSIQLKGKSRGAKYFSRNLSIEQTCGHSPK